MKQIDIKKPKYIIPAIALPFILGIGYMVNDMFNNNNKTSQNVQLTETVELNTEIQDANLENREVQSKFEALKKSFAKSSDFSSIQTIDKEEVIKEVEDGGSLYTNDEIRQIDSLNRASSLKRIELEKQLQSGSNLYNTEEADRSGSRENPEHSKMQDEMELFKMQMAYIDSIQNPQKYQEKISDEIKSSQKEDKEDVIEVVKAVNPAANYFNTIGKEEKTSLIAAILDENVKVVQGSRVRIRLLDDIRIEDAVLTKGTYVYGNVSGFTEQRVKINISSIMINGRRIKVDLSVFDNDGQEGFFVPQSSFRDLSKQIGSQLSSQNITMNTSDGGVEQFAYNALQDVYRSTSQAISKHIKKNKAKLKYNTQVYLINNNEKEN